MVSGGIYPVNPADTCWQIANVTLCWKKLPSDNPGLAPGQLGLLDKSLTSSGSYKQEEQMPDLLLVPKQTL